MRHDQRTVLTQGPYAWLRQTSKFHHHAFFARKIGHFRVPKTLTFKMRLGAHLFLWKGVLFAREWKMISISKAEQLPSFWNRGPGEFGNGLFSVFALFVREYSFQIYYLGNSFMQNFVTLQFQNQAWWWNLLIWLKHAQGLFTREVVMKFLSARVSWIDVNKFRAILSIQGFCHVES